MAAKTKNKKKQLPIELLASNPTVKSLGFKKTYSEDKSCYWYEKKIKNPFLKNLEVCIQKAPNEEYLVVSVYCAPQGDDIDEGFIVIYQSLFTTDLKLINLLKWFEDGSRGQK